MVVKVLPTMMKVLSTKVGQYRISERVGIEGTSDVGGGFDVGFTITRRVVGLPVSVTTAGTYTLHVRIASQTSRWHLPFRRRRSQL